MGLDPQKLIQSVLRALLSSFQARGGQGLSQEDLAKRLGFHSSTISRALRRLRIAGDVRARRDHVAGKKYRVLVYELTNAGLQRARSVPAGPVLALPPPEESFVGRTRELTLLRKGFSQGGVLVVDGVPGVGKSALVRRAIRLAPALRSTVWSTLHDAMGPGALWDSLVRGLALPGSAAASVPGSSAILPDTSPTLTAASTLALLEKNPRGVLWILDDVHAASATTLAALREALLAFPSKGRHAVVLITERELPWPLPQGAVVHLSLRGLTRRDALSLTEAVGLPEDRFETVYRETLGNPRFLRLSALQGLPEGENFADAVLKSLPEHQRRALVPLALTWGSVDRRSGLLGGLTPDELDALLSLAVLEEADGGLRLPEPLAKRVVERTPWEEVRRAHAILAGSVALTAPERFVHFVDAEQPREACRILASSRNDIVLKADARVMASALRLANALPKGRRRGDVLLAIAEIQRVWGDFVAASTFLERALEQLPQDDPEAMLAAGVLSITTLRSGHVDQAEHWARAVASLTKGHRWAAVASLARANLAAYRGDMDVAERSFAEAATLARRRHQEELLMMALHGGCYAAFQRNHYAVCGQLLREGLELARKLQRWDFLRILRVSELSLLSHEGKHREALEGYRQLLQDAERAEARPHMVSALMGMSAESRDLGDLTEAERLARQAASVAESTQDHSLIARAYGNLAWILRLQGRAAEAKALSSRALALSKEVGPSPAAAQVQEAWTLSRRGRKEGNRATVEGPGGPVPAPLPARRVRGEARTRA